MFRRMCQFKKRAYKFMHIIFRYRSRCIDIVVIGKWSCYERLCAALPFPLRYTRINSILCASSSFYCHRYTLNTANARRVIQVFALIFTAYRFSNGQIALINPSSDNFLLLLLLLWMAKEKIYAYSMDIIKERKSNNNQSLVVFHLQ